MDVRWTCAGDVERGLGGSQIYGWRWEGVEEAVGWFFEGENAIVEEEKRSWMAGEGVGGCKRGVEEGAWGGL